jgi:hypothetical protein
VLALGTAQRLAWASSYDIPATLAGLHGRAARAPITGISLLAGFASTVGWPLSALFEAQFGWRGACLAWAGLHLLLGLPLNRLPLPAAPPPPAALLGPAQVAAGIAAFGLLRRCHPLVSARLAALGHPLGAAALVAFSGPPAMVFAVLHGMGNGVLTIAKGTLPLAVFGPAGYGARLGWLGAPARMLQARAPFPFGLLPQSAGVGLALALRTAR